LNRKIAFGAMRRRALRRVDCGRRYCVTAHSSLSLSSSWRSVRAFHRRSRLGLVVSPPFGFRSASIALPTAWPTLPAA